MGCREEEDETLERKKFGRMREIQRVESRDRRRRVRAKQRRSLSGYSSKLTLARFLACWKSGYEPLIGGGPNPSIVIRVVACGTLDSNPRIQNRRLVPCGPSCLPNRFCARDWHRGIGADKTTLVQFAVARSMPRLFRVRLKQAVSRNRNRLCTP